MSDKNDGMFQSASEGGLAAQHGTSPLFPFLVGTSIDAEFNRLRLPLVTTFCCKVEDVRFSFDSSFVSLIPEPSVDPTADPGTRLNIIFDIRLELEQFSNFLNKHPGRPLTLLATLTSR